MSADDDDMGLNNNKDRIAAIKEKIERLECLKKKAAEEFEKIQQQQDGEEVKAMGDKNSIKMKQLEELSGVWEEWGESMKELLKAKDELRAGHYFAKADDIFPRKNSELVDKHGFNGAANNMMRKRGPVVDDASGNCVGLYDEVVKAFLNHLEPDSKSVADMNSVAASGATTGSTQKSDKDKPKTADSRLCIIPGTPEDGESAHQIPAAPSCAPWWGLVCLWAIGKLDKLEEFYKEIESNNNSAERQELEKCLRRALVQLVTGTGRGQGMRNCHQNILFVPDPHAEYYDAGYNWVIIPIMTLEEITGWNGGPYEVAVFVGSHAEEMKESTNERYNHFQDGPTRYPAEIAERRLFQDLDEEKIKICTKEDLTKVTDVLAHFLKAFADLHIRSRREDGRVSPRKWGIIDLAEAAKELTNGIEDTKERIFEDSEKGIENLIERLLKESSGSEETGGIRVPKCPLTNCFGGKHVFKASVRQACTPDPMFVGGKGALNFGRQWGIKLLSACAAKSDSDSCTSCWSRDEGHSNTTPLPSKDFTGFEIAVATLDGQSTSDDYDIYGDAFSDISTDDIDMVGEEGAI